MAQGDPDKWNMSGWRIEQKYSTKVLIGNWQEERLKVGFLDSVEDCSSETSTISLQIPFFRGLV